MSLNGKNVNFDDSLWKRSKIMTVKQGADAMNVGDPTGPSTSSSLFPDPAGIGAVVDAVGSAVMGAAFPSNSGDSGVESGDVSDNQYASDSDPAV